MGERHNGGGHTARPLVLPGPETRTADALRAALRPRRLDPEAEARALAAFLDAHKQRQGTRPMRTRRRDDWRPSARRRACRSLRTLLAVLLSGAALGGVAVAARGDLPHDTAPRRPAGSQAPRTPGPPQRTSGIGTAGETPGVGGRSGRAAPPKASRSPGGATRKAAGKGAKARRKADRKSAKAAARDVKKAAGAAEKADKAAKKTGKGTEKVNKGEKRAEKPPKYPKPSKSPKLTKS
ncbi:hypothetical protein ABZ876_02615 [Streptomyces sp. NPDC046931]|uniref:hypothetical protein n=1 Tax=Streptomyces sp. NPDC046931 TaxID=3154806 RepID=UPI0033E8986B